jgi:hypothetical protein
MHSLTELAKRFSDSEPIDVTFDSAVASSEGLELLTSTHPLVRTALEHLRESSRLGLARFGRVRFDGCPPGAYCVVIYVLEMTGLRPVKRLWPVAVDASSGDVRDDVGDAFLTAVARGSVRSTTANLPARLDKLVLRARDHAVSEMEKIKKQHERDNELILESRLTAVRAEVDHKIRRTRATLAKVADSTARRIYLGRLGRLEADLEQRTAELQSKKGVAASLRQVSVVVVKGGR